MPFAAFSTQNQNTNEIVEEAEEKEEVEKNDNKEILTLFATKQNVNVV